MPKSMVITRENIKEDIINCLKANKKLTKSEYKRMTIPMIIIGCLLGVISFFSLKISIYGLIIWIIVSTIVNEIFFVLNRNKIKNTSIDDYEIITETISHKSEEKYKINADNDPNFHKCIKENYTLHFENGKSWLIPDKNYLWSQELATSDYYIYQNANRGDIFILAIDKRTNEIAMAYDTKQFTYKG